MKKVLITEICDILVGRTPSRYNPDYWGTGFPWLSIADMNQGELLSTTKETITAEAVKECNCKQIPKGTVLFSFKLSIGKVGITDVDMFTNEAIAAFLIKDKSILDTKFLFYTLKSTDYSVGSNKAVMGKTLNKEQLKKFTIPLPPIEEQHRIVKILDLAQSLIEKRKRAIAYLDDYIKAVFLDMFGDPVSNPKGIKTLKGGELFGFSSGKFNPTKNLSQEYSYPTYGGNGITGFSQKYFIDYPTIVIGRVGAYCGSIHKILSKSWVTDNAIFISKFKLKVNLDFLFYQFIFLNFNRFSDFSGQPKITQKPLESTNYLFPDLVDQNKFSKIVQKTESLKQIMQSQLKELEKNFQTQIQRAFRGKLSDQIK